MDDADALMEHLPPSGWADVARRSDLDHLHELIKLDLAAEMPGLRGEMHGLRGEMHGMRGDLLEKMADQTRTLMVGMTATVVAALGTVATLSVVIH